MHPSDTNLAPNLCWDRLPLDSVRLLCKNDTPEVLQGFPTKRGAPSDELSRKTEGIHLFPKEIEKSFQIILGKNAECVDRAGKTGGSKETVKQEDLYGRGIKGVVALSV